MKFLLGALLLGLGAIVLWTTWNAAPSERPALALPSKATGERAETEADPTMAPPRTQVQDREQGSQEPEPAVGGAPASSDPFTEKYGDLEGEQLDQVLEALDKEYWALYRTELERHIALGWSETVSKEEAVLLEGDTDHDKLGVLQSDGVTHRKISLTRAESQLLFALRDEYYWVWEKRYGSPHPQVALWRDRR